MAYAVHDPCGHTTSGLGRCKPCYGRAYYEANKDQWPTPQARRQRYAEDDHDPRRAYFLKWGYGITPDDYAVLLERQGGNCAICNAPCPTGRRLGVDHDHYTKVVRGLLCNRCNTLIGLALESESILEVAADYLRAA